MSLALIPKYVLKRVPPEDPYVIYKKSQRLPLRQRRSTLVHTQHRSGHLSGNPLKFAKTNSCAQEEKRSRRPRAKRLVQGSIPGSATSFNDGFTQPSYPTVVQQARNNINSFENCVVLTRVGSFYELYFEQAEQYAPALHIKLAKKRTTVGPVSMAGFPFFQLERFLKILVHDMNKAVAISEEFINTSRGRGKAGGLMFDRRITRVITPGTLIDEKFVDPLENNFLLSIYINRKDLDQSSSDSACTSSETETETSLSPNTIGLAWLDLSSGDFFVKETSLQGLVSEVALIKPREILLDTQSRDADNGILLSRLTEYQHMISYQHLPDTIKSVSEWVSMLETPPGQNDLSALSELEIGAGAFLLQYVTARLQGTRMKLQFPIRRNAKKEMVIDQNSLRALEIRTTLKEGNFAGSLLHSIRKTSTKSGARLLSQRLTSPSTSLEVINNRLDLVAKIIQKPALPQSLVNLLKRTFDTLRLLQKFSFGRGDADDLISVAKTIRISNQIALLLRAHVDSPQSDAEAKNSAVSNDDPFAKILSQFDFKGPMQVATRILSSIDEEGLSEHHRLEGNQATETESTSEEVTDEVDTEETDATPSRSTTAPNGDYVTKSPSMNQIDGDIWITKKDASITLQRLHDELVELREKRRVLARTYRAKLGATTLTLRWTPALGHVVHIKGRDINSSNEILNSLRNVKTSKSTRSFYLPEWTSLGNTIDETKLRIRAEEQLIIASLRKEVIHNLSVLRQNATVLDELDVSCSFATLAIERRLVRPSLHMGASLKIIGGRHPVVETGLVNQGRTFTTNDCSIDENEKILLITGPNMAGKSTFLRQNALIAILAQTGSYVPAEYAEIGIIDKIFSRVGSADNLFQDQSTFMVEMLETAEILKQATKQSFVIMDEVGRGTTPEDGIAIGFSCLDHLYHKNQSRALFATHFHSLADMTKDLKKISCYCTDVQEEQDGSFTYNHRLKRGVNKRSHALKVARLAGMPESAIKVASDVFKRLKALPNGD